MPTSIENRMALGTPARGFCCRWQVPDGIVGHAPRFEETLERIHRVSTTNATVLITGETGTGKELVARAIHRRSPRSSHAMVSAIRHSA